MNVYMYPTHNDWFEYLKKNRELDEANFWQPRGHRVFTALSPGDLFLFRLKTPVLKIGGGGFFLHSSLVPLSTMWDAFGVKNGTSGFRQLASMIAPLRGQTVDATIREDPAIGCIILTGLFFLPPEHYIDLPADYSLSLVQGKKFTTDSATAKKLVTQVQELLQFGFATEPASVKTPMASEIYGDPRLVRQRLGQGSFRLLVADAYDRRCAITNEHTLPVLEAAHIVPVSSGGIHSLQNGLLLRSDIHTLFDKGYVTVTPDGIFRVSKRLKEEWNNGRIYYDLQGRHISVPADPTAQPAEAHLEWHNDEVFRG